MSDIVIKVEALSKAYQIGQIGTGTISRDLERFWITRIRGKEDPFLKIGESNDRTTKGNSDIVWSLKDINFEIQQGDAVGIIGRNGAGKSTLLKCLSRVTSPTAGEIKVKGRIASLLEVGTGFHPELTGRENIYLNGAILGMRKKEITRKLDEIIDFSGVERYVDTPVKRYSSGMYVRLAFAVAAHLESEILIVDEVLAVGDAEFQKKCLGKMGDISKGQGRTVLFVSHNMAAVKSLCSRAMVLENGMIKSDDTVDKAVSYYLSSESNAMNRRIFEAKYDKEYFKLNEISVRNSGRQHEDPISENEEIVLYTSFFLKDDRADRYHITYHLYNEMGEPLFSLSHADEGITSLQHGQNHLECIFPKSFFQPGQYFLSFYCIQDRRSAIFIEKDIVSFTVVDAGRELGVYMGKEPGFIRPKFNWRNSHDTH